jgi:hypothetical protein
MWQKTAHLYGLFPGLLTSPRQQGRFDCMPDESAMGQDAVARQLKDLVEISRSRGLVYPIENKTDFVAQMSRSADPVIFRGQAYDPAWSSQLIPDFFFPVASERDLVARAVELLIARGMLPLESMPAGGGADPSEPEASREPS